MKLFVVVVVWISNNAACAAQQESMPWEIQGPIECRCCPLPYGDRRNLQKGTTEVPNVFQGNCKGRQRYRRACNSAQVRGTGGGGRGFRGGRGEGRGIGGRGKGLNDCQGRGRGGGRGRARGFRGGQGRGSGGGGWAVAELSDKERLEHHNRMCTLMEEEGEFDCDRNDFDFVDNCTIVVLDTSTTSEP